MFTILRFLIQMLHRDNEIRLLNPQIAWVFFGKFWFITRQIIFMDLADIVVVEPGTPPCVSISSSRRSQDVVRGITHLALKVRINEVSVKEVWCTLVSFWFFKEIAFSLLETSNEEHVRCHVWKLCLEKRGSGIPHFFLSIRLRHITKSWLL